MLVPPSTSSVHVQGEMGKDPVAEASKRVEAERKAVQARLTAVKASRDSYVAKQVSGEDVVQLMMFRDDVTARFDEELAKLEKERLEVEQEGLEVEKKGVEAERKAVQERLTVMKASRDSYVAKQVSGEDVVQLMMFEDNVTARFDEKLAKLEKEGLELEQSLKSINAQRETLRNTYDKLVGQVGQARQQQSTKRTHEKADLGSSGYTPEGKQRAAHGPSTGRVSPRTLEPVAAPHAWKVDLCLPRGLVYRGLLRKLYEFAGQRLAFDADIQYVPVDGQYTLDSDLRFTAYTKREDKADHLHRDILDFCAQCVGATFEYPRGFMPEYVEHTVRQPIYAFFYKAEDSPDVEDREEEPREPSSPSATVVPEARAHNEYVIGAEAAYRGHLLPEACHLLEKHDYSKELYPLIEGDYANRIILERNLHNMFDDKRLPAVTFFCETPSADLPEWADPPRALTLVACFTHTVYAREVGGRFKASTAKSPTDVAFTISHPRPRAFVRYLHLRHALNCKAMGLAHKTQDRSFVHHFNSLKSMTVSELSVKARDLGVEGRSNMLRDALLDAVLHAAIHCDEFSSETTSDS